MALDYNEVFKFMREFECDFINRSNELIIDKKSNTYIGLESIKDIRQLETMVVFVLCRPIGKGLEDRPARMLLKRVNKYFNAHLSQEDMRVMYTELCYMHKVDEFRRFIDRGFPMQEIKTEANAY